jgi:hypothetical protein
MDGIWIQLNSIQQLVQNSIQLKRNEIWIELDSSLIEWNLHSIQLKRTEIWIELDSDLIEWNLNSI